jgi:uncharacterized protein VirK/YbjX
MGVKPAEYSASSEVSSWIGASIASGAEFLLLISCRCYAEFLFLLNTIYHHKGWNPLVFIKVFTVFPSIVLLNWRSHQNILKLINLPAFRGIIEAQPQFPFKYISAPYLARGLTPSKRVRALVYNYEFLEKNFSEAFLREIVHGWSPIYETAAGNNNYAIVMGLSAFPFKEGELSLELHLNGSRIFVVSFTFVQCSIIDVNKKGHAILLSRVQGERGLFQQIKAATKDMHDISPPYLLFSALNGIACALNVSYIFGTSGTRQICFTADRADIFIDTYDDFFISLGATENVNGFFCFDVPLRNKQLQFIKRDHRSRTKKKRRFKATISERALSVIHQNCRPLRPLSSLERMNGVAGPARHWLSNGSR